MNLPMFHLDDTDALESATVGTKAAGLARLRRAGIDVPDGFVLGVGIAGRWPDGPAPADIRTAVEQACAALDGPVAVRTSSTWEDGSTSAHAGATTTILGVEGVDDVLDAIRTCIAASTEAQRLHGATGSMAILLQRLVPADWAGVAFSADPITGDRSVVRIAGTPGLGEALVQGDVVGTDLAVRGAAIEGDPGGMATDLVLAVAAVTRQIESIDGHPQDVEWAVTGTRVHVLQARPITVLPICPTPPEGNNWQKDVAHYPEPLTPFGWSAIQLAADDIREVFDEAGVLIRGLEEVSVGGEIYGRPLPAFGSANSAGAPPPAFVLGLAARIVPALRRRVRTAEQVVATDRIGRWADEWHRSDRNRMIRRGAELLAIDLSALSDDELVTHAGRCAEFVREGTRIHFRLMMSLFHALYGLHRIVSDELGWDDAEVFRMLAGHSPATRAAEESMAELRCRLRSIDGAIAALEADPHHPLDVLERYDTTLAADIRAWLENHGWAMVNYDAGVPVLAETPAMATRLLLNDTEATDFTDADEVAERARAALRPEHRAAFDHSLADARAKYPMREDNTVIVGDRPLALLRRWMLEAADRLVARGALDHRGNAAYLSIDELQAALFGSGGDLRPRVQRRRGEEAFTRANPGPRHIGDHGAMPDISRLPTALRQVNEPILWAVGHEYPPPSDVPRDADVLLAGIAASAGQAEGPARIVRTHQDIGRLLPGDILVCQVTSPSWAPLFPLAAAVVADGGGVLSHAAIAAREHGLPAVLGTGSGTTMLTDGQRIRVDGTSGLVFALD